MTRLSIPPRCLPSGRNGPGATAGAARWAMLAVARTGSTDASSGLGGEVAGALADEVEGEGGQLESLVADLS